MGGKESHGRHFHAPYFGKIAVVAIFADEGDEIMRKTEPPTGDNG